MSLRVSTATRPRTLPQGLTAGASLLLATGAILLAPLPVDAATLDRRATPIAFVGATTSTACPTPEEASGASRLAPLARFTARPARPNAAEALLASWLEVPAPILAVCDPEAAASGRALGPIAGTAKVAPWSDAVGVGRRVRGGSHITGIGALHPGDRYVLPPVSATAVVDAAVHTSTGVRMVRASTPPGTSPQAVTVDGPPSARVVVVTGANGTTARTPAPPAKALRATVRAATPRVTGGRIALQVKATPGAVIIAMPTTRSYDGRRERKMYTDAIVATAGANRTTISVPVDRSLAGLDVVVLGLAHRQLAGARCTLRNRRSVECRRDAIGPMALWSERHPDWVEGELEGKYDEIVGASYPELRAGEGPLSKAIDEIEDLPGITPDFESGPGSADPAPEVPRTKQRSGITIPAMGTSIDRVAGLSADEQEELVDDAVYGSIQMGDANGDLRPDFLVGFEVPRLLLSTPSGLAGVDFDTGGDGGSFAPDLDGDGTTELLDALGSVVLGQRSWATTVPTLVGEGAWETGGPGRLPWSHDELGSAPVPLSDINRDGRLELLDAGRTGLDAVYSGADLPLGSRTRLPVLLEPIAADPLRALQDDLGVRARYYIGGSRGVPDETFTTHAGGATVRLMLDDGRVGQPDASTGTLLRWASIDLAGPGGVDATSTPLRVFSRPDLVDADGPSGDLLIRVATRFCVQERDACDQILRVTRAGAVRAWFGATGSGLPTCAFVDDGSDPDQDSEVVCTARTGKLPSRWLDYDRVGTQALALASSALRGAQSPASLPRLTFNGQPLRTTSGFAKVRLANGRRVLSTTAISGQGRSATARLVVIDAIG